MKVYGGHKTPPFQQTICTLVKMLIIMNQAPWFTGYIAKTDLIVTHKMIKP